MTDSPLQAVVAALEKLGGPIRHTGDSVAARCPAHEDDNPSLSVTPGINQPVVLHCHAGCDVESILTALGLTFQDISASREDRPRDADEWTPAGPASDVYDYCDANGELLFQVLRVPQPGGKKTFFQRVPDLTAKSGWRWKLGDTQRVIYHLPQVLAAIADGREVWIVEGEKDVHTLARHGVTATCNAQGAGSWRPEYSVLFADAHVRIVADRDKPGRAHARQVADSLADFVASVTILEPVVGKDVTDHLAAGKGLDDLISVDKPGVDVHLHPDTRMEQPVPASVTPSSRMPILPEEFWAARPEFGHIRRAAHSRLASADLVLHVVLAKIAAMSSHELVFDSGRGRSSTNYFAAIVGPSGIGKTSGASAVDEQLLPVPNYLTTPLDLTAPEPFYDGLPLGSGEGVAEAYMGMTEVEVDTKKNGDPIMKKVRAMVRHNVLVLVDEGETFTRLGERTGATVSTTLRSAWVGTTIGQANGRDDTTRILRAHSYSLGMVVGFQLHTAHPLLVDTATGTAQRFAWVSAADPNLPDEQVEHPGPLRSLAMADAEFSNTAWTGTMPFPDSVIAELRRDHIAKIRGELLVDERNSQAPLMRAKMAALLALLNGRHDVTVDDWDLASVLWETSCRVRDHVTEHGAQEKARQAELVAEARVQMEERKAAAVNGVDAKITRLAITLAERVIDAGGLKRGDARRGMPSRDRHLYDQVVERAMSNSLLRTVDGGGLVPPIRAAS